MNTQTVKQFGIFKEDLRRVMAKQTLGLPLTGRENSYYVVRTERNIRKRG